MAHADQADTIVLARPIAVDGDTLRQDAVRYRLAGLDAPEAGQRCPGLADCADRARQVLDAHAPPLVCLATATDRYGRPVVSCRDALGRDPAAAVVAAGLAMVDPCYPSSYAGLAAEARAAGRGFWREPPLEPWNWRRSTRGQGPRAGC